MRNRLWCLSAAAVLALAAVGCTPLENGTRAPASASHEPVAFAPTGEPAAHAPERPAEYWTEPPSSFFADVAALTKAGFLCPLIQTHAWDGLHLTARLVLSKDVARLVQLAWSAEDRVVVAEHTLGDDDMDAVMAVEGERVDVGLPEIRAWRPRGADDSVVFFRARPHTIGHAPRARLTVETLAAVDRAFAESGAPAHLRIGSSGDIRELRLAVTPTVGKIADVRVDLEARDSVAGLRGANGLREELAQADGYWAKELHALAARTTVSVEGATAHFQTSGDERELRALFPFIETAAAEHVRASANGHAQRGIADLLVP